MTPYPEVVGVTVHRPSVEYETVLPVHAHLPLPLYAEEEVCVW